MKVLDTVQDIIANLAIVTAYLFFANQVIFKDRNLKARASLPQKIRIGIADGILGIVLLIFTVHMNGTLLDFRNMAVIVSALSGGMTASLITGTIVFAMRLFASGAVTFHALVAAFGCLLFSVLAGYWCTRPHWTYRMKWFWSITATNVITGIVIFVNAGKSGFIPALVYVVMMSAGGWATARLLDFLERTKQHLNRMERESTTDYLTGLNNHRTFDRVFNQYLQEAEENAEPLSLALVDIDFFKKVNDTYGHDSGDAVLKQLGELLCETTRPSDTVSRNGGEEFSILLRNTTPKHAAALAEQVRLAVENHRFLLPGGLHLRLTVSVGIASYPETRQEELYRLADEALYTAKASGRNKVRTR